MSKAVTGGGGWQGEQLGTQDLYERLAQSGREVGREVWQAGRLESHAWLTTYVWLQNVWLTTNYGMFWLPMSA